jgi:hypothetical protein
MIFEESEIKIIADEMFNKASWRKSKKIQDAIMDSNHLKGGKPVPVSSCLDENGLPCSPLLKEFLEKLDQSVYIEFFMKTKPKLLQKLPEVIKNKMIAYSL